MQLKCKINVLHISNIKAYRTFNIILNKSK